MPARVTYLLIDGENIDATLGSSILKRRPHPEERPRWERVREFAAKVWGQPVKALFFLNVTSTQMPLPFVQALLAMDYRPLPLAGEAGEKVVDIAIQRTLEAIAERDGDVLLASHDADFAPQVQELLDGDRRVGVLAFREYLSGRLAELAGDGLQVYDLEEEVACFTTALPRVRVIRLEDFDPTHYL